MMAATYKRQISDMAETTFEDFDFTKRPDVCTPYGCVNVIHVLPGCDEYIDEWRSHNDEFVVLNWDHESLERVRKATPILCELNGVSAMSHDEKIMYSSMLVYNFGGVVLSRPLRCAARLQAFLQSFHGTLLITFAASDGSLDEVMISGAKIQAFVALFEYFTRAKEHNKTFSDIYREFIVASQKASAERAIICLSHVTLQRIVGGAAAGSTRPLVNPSGPLVAPTSMPMMGAESFAESEWVRNLMEPLIGKTFSICNLDSETKSTTFIETCKDWLEKEKAVEKEGGDREGIDICVIDTGDFDVSKPVPMALYATNTFQRVNLKPKGGLLIIGNCPQKGVALDMLLRPQLELHGAKEIHRDGYVVWQM